MKVLIVDDDPGYCDLVTTILSREGFSVLSAYDAEAALRIWHQNVLDLILIDLNLATTKGFTVLRTVRATEDDTPVIMITASESEDDLVEALNLGADEYVQKPISSRSFVARVKALLRRTGQPLPHEQRVYQFDEFRYDSNARRVQFNGGQSIQLTVLEDRLLEHLIVNRPVVLSYESLINYIWGRSGADQDMLRQLVRRLRKKIEPDPNRPTIIVNVPSRGYGIISIE